MSSDLTARAPRTRLVEGGRADLHTADMTVTFAGDITLRTAQDLLAASNQWLPIDGDPDAMLSHLIETDSTGPLRLGYGAWRDLLLGVQFENGSGELISAGGRTVKNVAGYDLTKFMVGQAGIFGRILTLTTRTYLQPAFTLLARTEPSAAIVTRLFATPCKPHWALLTAEHLLLGYLGDRPMIDYQRSALPKYISAGLIERGLTEDRADRARLWRASGPATFRASVPPAQVERFVGAVPLVRWVADPAFGIILGSVASAEARQNVADAARAVGGSIRALETTAQAPAFVEASESERRIVERLKTAFDPESTLSPLPWRNQP